MTADTMPPPAPRRVGSGESTLPPPPDHRLNVFVVDFDKVRADAIARVLRTNRYTPYFEVVGVERDIPGTSMGSPLPCLYRVDVVIFSPDDFTSVRIVNDLLRKGFREPALYLVHSERWKEPAFRNECANLGLVHGFYSHNFKQMVHILLRQVDLLSARP